MPHQTPHPRRTLPTVLLLGLLALVVMGCASQHVKIQLPQSNASVQSRVYAFRHYRRKGLGYRIYIERYCIKFRDSRGRRLEEPERYTTRELNCPEGREVGRRRMRERLPSSLLLGNGEFVHYLEDILPAVDSRSRTAHHAKRSITYSNKARASFGIGVAISLGAGGALTGIGFGVAAANSSDPAGIIVAMTGIGIAAVGTVTSAIVGAVFSARSNDHRLRAYRTYNRDLLHKLNISRHHLKSVPKRQIPDDQDQE